MRYIHASVILATGYLAHSASALPAPNPAATYSVVDVGGPSSTEAAETIYATVTAPAIHETITQKSTPSTVTEELTVAVASPTEPTATKEATVTIVSPAESTATTSWTVTIGGTAISVLTTTVSETDEMTPRPVVAATDTVFYNAPPEPAPTPETTSTPCSTISTTFKSTFATAISQWSYGSSAVVRPTGSASFVYKPLITGVSSGYLSGKAAPTYDAWSWNSTTTRFRAV